MSLSHPVGTGAGVQSWLPSLLLVLGGVCSPFPLPGPVTGAAAAGLSFLPGSWCGEDRKATPLLLRDERVGESCAAGLPPLCLHEQAVRRAQLLPLPAGDGQGAGRGGQHPPGRAGACETLELSRVGPANSPVHPRAWHW